MRRRTFLGAAGSAIAGSAGLLRAHAALDRIGIQLYTVRSLMRQDVERTLERIAGIGYREVEFAGYFGRTPRQLRATLDSLGLVAPAAHIPMQALSAGWEETLEAAQVIGHAFLAVAWIDARDRRTIDDWHRIGGLFDRAGESARRAGIRFMYHNHDFEFAPLEGRVPYDVLLAGTDRELVQLEMDLFWIAKAGRDPLEYFDRYPGRFPCVHVKDMGEGERMVDVGRGRLDFARVFRRARQAGIRHYFVEHDEPADPLDSARVSFDYLRRLRP